MSEGHAIRDNAHAQRFEVETDAGTAYIAYHLIDSVVSLDHTDVPEALAGRGVGSALVKGTLDLIRSRQQKIVARCSFVAKYLERHPEYAQLLAD